MENPGSPIINSRDNELEYSRAASLASSSSAWTSIADKSSPSDSSASSSPSSSRSSLSNASSACLLVLGKGETQWERRRGLGRKRERERGNGGERDDGERGLQIGERMERVLDAVEV